MPRFVALLFALVSIGVAQGLAQEKPDLPPRFAPLAKNDHFRLVRVLGMPEMPVIHHQASAYSADGKLAVFAEDLSSGDDKKPVLRTRLLVWDMPAKAWPREIEIDGKNVSALCLSADGSKALLAGQIVVGVKKVKAKEKEEKVVVEFGAYLGLWDLRTGKELRFVSFKGAEPPACVALGLDEITALAGGRDGVQRWDLKDGKLLGSYREKDVATQVMTLAFLPDGKRFLAGNWVSDEKRSGVVRLWDTSKQDPVRTFPAKGELGFVLALGVARDGKRFVCADTRPSVSVWETDTGKEVGTFVDKKQALDEVVTNAVLADDGKTVLGVFSKLNAEPDDFASASLVAWDAEAKKTVWSHKVAYRGRAPMLLQDGKLLIGGGPNLFETWNIKDGAQTQSWGGHKGPISALAVQHDGDILSAGLDGSLLTWHKGKAVSRSTPHAGAITALVVSRDGKEWLHAGADRSLRTWPPGAPQPIYIKNAHAGPITSLAFSKAATWAASGSGDRSIKTWNLKAGKEIATFVHHAESVNAIAISPDDRWFASASDDTTIRVWPIKDGKLDADREPLMLEHHKKPVTCIAFSPDGKTLLSGSQDQTLKVWDWQKEKVTRTIPGHKNWVTSILFIDDANVLTTSDDLTICQWEFATGKELGRIDFGSVSDCPRCLTRLGSDRLLVGTSNWLIYEFEMKSNKGTGSSKK